MKTLAIALAGAGALVLSTPVLAHGPRSGSHMHRDTEEQQAGNEDRADCESRSYGPAHHTARPHRTVCTAASPELSKDSTGSREREQSAS